MKKRFLLIAAVLAFVLSLTACGTALPAVYVQSVSQIMGYSPMGAFNACAGVVVAQNEVKVERDESRKVAELLVEVGQEVCEGDVLFVYDTAELQISINKLKLEIEQMKNTVSDLTSQISELEKEKKKAPDADQLSYTVRIQGLETDKDETQYYIKVKQQELQTMQATARSGEVTAPIDGKIKAIYENGGYDDATGQPLPYITLIQSGAYRIKGTINELNREELTVGQTVIIRSRLDESRIWTGTLTELDSTPVDSGNSGYYYGYADEMTSSSSYAFYVDLDDTEGLLLGQHVYIEPDQGQTLETFGLWLYADYVQSAEDGSNYVWAADSSGRLEKRIVTLGQYDELQYAWQITKGLTAEDRVAYPAENLQEGAPLPDEAAPDDGENAWTDLSENTDGEIAPEDWDSLVEEESAGQ